MKAMWITLGVIVVGILIFFGKFINVRNQIVTQKEAITASWAQVDNVMQRRADLIPNLVETVKGYAKHEQAAVQEVAQARAAFAGARTPQDRIQANSQIDSALSRLLVIVENYPNLKADQQFLNLQRELAGTENRIAIERQQGGNQNCYHYYNCGPHHSHRSWHRARDKQDSRRSGRPLPYAGSA